MIDRSARLSGKTVLQRLPELHLQLSSDGSLRVEADGRVVDCRSHGLAVLETFARPTPLAEGLAQLQRRVAGAHDWVELMDTIANLHAAGILLDPRLRPPLRSGPHGFDAARPHLAMLDDRGRTEGFLAGIRRTVRPGDVVVDLGTGTGVLALAAARAGAARVYAIEASGIAAVARRLFQANRLADRITLVEGWSTRVTLPERADVLVSEIVGNEPFGEAVLEFFADARRRFLKAGARVVPRRLRVFGTPVTVPPAVVRSHGVTDATVARWRRWYGFDFGPLVEAARRTPGHFYVNPWRARTWPTLTDPVPLVDVDLGRPRSARPQARRRIEAGRAGVLGGLLLHFELETGGATITTDPCQVRKDNCWLSPVWLADTASSVRRGDPLVVAYSRGRHGSRASCRLARP